MAEVQEISSSQVKIQIFKVFLSPVVKVRNAYCAKKNDSVVIHIKTDVLSELWINCHYHFKLDFQKTDFQMTPILLRYSKEEGKL